jgi:hypothetical protein
MKLEKLCYQGLQKNYGRTAAVRAPGTFVTQLTREAAHAGGGVETTTVGKTKLSQTCI